MTLYDIISPRTEGDVARLYVEARCLGLEVTHYTTKECKTFDGKPSPGCVLGVFRNVGSLIWWKQERRWEVRACVDAGPVDLATLIHTGFAAVHKHGRTPGHFTRNRVFRHADSVRNGKPIATAGVAYQLSADDLLASTRAEEREDLDVTVRAILESSTT